MGESEIKYYDEDGLTKENSYYAQIIFRSLRKDGNPVTKFNKDSKIEFERAKIEISIKIAARDERDEIVTIEKTIKDDTGDFYVED
ncbi:MAG: hypothetical protein ACRC7N_22255 [Clostridium sp.]